MQRTCDTLTPAEQVWCGPWSVHEYHGQEEVEEVRDQQERYGSLAATKSALKRSPVQQEENCHVTAHRDAEIASAKLEHATFRAHEIAHDPACTKKTQERKHGSQRD